jgi:hypothetical protein
LLSVEL